MKQKEIVSMAITGLLAAIISLLISGVIFHSTANKGAVPQPPDVPATFPDVTHDPIYQSFLNKNSLDPAAPVQIGNGRNATPFNTQ